MPQCIWESIIFVLIYHSLSPTLAKGNARGFDVAKKILSALFHKGSDKEGKKTQNPVLM
jgi:hypothetical protein